MNYDSKSLLTSVDGTEDEIENAIEVLTGAYTDCLFYFNEREDCKFLKMTCTP